MRRVTYTVLVLFTVLMAQAQERGAETDTLFQRVGDTVPAEVLVNLMQQTWRVRLFDCVIDGNVEYHDTILCSLMLKRCTFRDTLDLRGVTIPAWTCLDSCTFEGPALFTAAKSLGQLNFGGCIFSERAQFDSMSCCSGLSFYHTVFADTTSFKSTVATGDGDLSWISFTSASFHGPVDFSQLVCSTRFVCNDGVFYDYANFAGAIFQGSAQFWRNTFVGYADFVGISCPTYLSLLTCRFEGLEKRGGDWYSGSFQGARLTGDALFRGTDLSGVRLELDSSSQGALKGFVYANGLRYLKCYYTGTLADLRRYFRNNHYRQQERELVCALQRHGQGLLDRLAFDLPFEYGANLSRPFSIVFVIFCVCSLVYLIVFHRRQGAGVIAVIQIVDEQTGCVTESRQRVASSNRQPDALWPRLWAILHTEGELLGTAFLFSLLSTFNVGFRDMSFGRWLTLILPRKVTFVPFGWVRSVSGLQSVVSVLLMAFALIFHFGRFFD